jgi:hypothetical protein
LPFGFWLKLKIMSAAKNINITLKIWRQKNAKTKGGIETYKLDNVSTASSFLEMLDQLNEQLVNERKEPVAFDHDCREGICGVVRYTSTDVLTDPIPASPLVSCTCECSTTVIPFMLNHGEVKLFR